MSTNNIFQAKQDKLRYTYNSLSFPNCINKILVYDCRLNLKTIKIVFIKKKENKCKYVNHNIYNRVCPKCCGARLEEGGRVKMYSILKE